MSTAEKVLAALQPYNLKPGGQNKYRCNSPFRPGSDSMSFSVMIIDDEKGAWFDHRDEIGGSLYDLAAKLGIEVTGRQQVENTKRAYTGIEDYAAAHGVTAEVLMKAGWKEVEYMRRPALEFVTRSGPRWRFLDNKKNAPVYIHKSGYERCWYGLNTAAASRLLKEPQPLVICNGEISTVVAHHYGLAAACVTSGEKAAIPPHLIDELKDFLDDVLNPPILIAFDCDPKGSTAAKGLESQLRAAGFIAHAVDLGLGNGGDLADFCMLYGEAALKVLTSLPTLPDPDSRPTTHFGWSLMHSKDLKNLPRVEWVVPKQIQALGINIIYGQSGVGKSFLALHYALTVAQQSPVIYMAGEGVYGYEKRITAWEIHHKRNRANLYICTGAVSLLDPEEFHAFLQQSESLKPALVIVDTLSRSMVGGDENSTRDMMLFIQACDRIKQHLGCAVLLVHHVGKGNRSEERGSSALRGAADVMIRVSALGDDIAVEFSKVKDESPLPESYFRLLNVSWQENGSDVSSLVFIESERVIQTTDDPLTNNQQKVLRLLNEDFSQGATVIELATEAQSARGSVQRTIRDLLNLGYVQQEQPGAPYLITDPGKAALQRTHDSMTHMTHVTHNGSRDFARKNDESHESLSHVGEIWGETAQETVSHHMSHVSHDSPEQKSMFTNPKSHYSEGL
ncbi:MAG: AAA family ATPase [Anaerolineae bacterium]|nr:AAA family ATPase [Anaerolineae bacterium]